MRRSAETGRLRLRMALYYWVDTLRRPLLDCWWERLRVALALVACLGLLEACPREEGGAGAVRQGGLVDRVLNEATIHAGYGVYPPYSIEDAASHKISGFSVDLTERIAKELRCKVVWHRVNWDTMSADLKRGTFDVISDPIFQTIPRAPEFAFSEPYAYFADGIGVVRKGDQRFKAFDDLDKLGIKVSVGQGQASEALLRARFTQATIEPVPATTDNMQIFAPVLAGRSDAAVADEANATRFAAEHPSQVDVLWLNSPPAYMPAGFALRPSDERGAQMLTVCLRYLRATGFLEKLAKKYQLKTIASDKVH